MSVRCVMFRVNLYATLRDVIGGKTVEVDLPDGVTAQQLVERLVEMHPPLRDKLLDEEMHFQPHMKLFVNGREVVYLEQRFDTPLHPDDRVDIFPPVAGG